MKRCLPLLIICVVFAFSAEANAQELRITNTSPADGATSVPLQTNLSLTFNQPLIIDDVLETAIIMIPEGRVLVDVENVSLSGDQRSVIAPVTHTEQGDYTVAVLGGYSGGNHLAEPVAVNYTTLPTAGQHSISGTVQLFEFGFPLKNGEPVERILARSNVQQSIASLVPGRKVLFPGSAGWTEAMKSAPAPASAESLDPRNVAILLFTEDPWEEDEEENGDDDEVLASLTRSGIVTDEEGEYEIGHVRDGRYYGMAIRFIVTGGMYVVDAIGFIATEEGYVDVEGGSVTDVDFFVLTFGAQRALDVLEQARDIADQIAEDQELYRIVGFGVNEDGSAFGWHFMFYSETADLTTEITLPRSPGEEPEVSEGRWFPEEVRAIPASIVDSDAAMMTAEANGGADFRATHEDAMVVLDGGDLYWDDEEVEEIEGRFVWNATYIAFTGEGVAILYVYVDMQTGEFVTSRMFGTPVEPGLEQPQTFALGQNFPNPFNPATTIPFSLTDAGYVSLKIYDLAGRHVATLVDGALPVGEHAAVWNGSELASGVYMYRLEMNGRAQTRPLVLHK